jgi:hypothetical protein
MVNSSDWYAWFRSHLSCNIFLAASTNRKSAPHSPLCKVEATRRAAPFLLLFGGSGRSLGAPSPCVPHAMETAKRALRLLVEPIEHQVLLNEKLEYLRYCVRGG